MGVFDGPDEALRRQRLKELEDKRVRFAERVKRDGFAPESMLAASTEFGGLTALCLCGGQLWMVSGPDFGGEGEFTLERCDPSSLRREDFLEKPVGLGGVLGMGKRGAVGFILKGGSRDIPFIAGRNSWAEWPLKRNPLLSEKRRRGDANVIWDMQPLEARMLKRIEGWLAAARIDAAGGKLNGK